MAVENTWNIIAYIANPDLNLRLDYKNILSRFCAIYKDLSVPKLRCVASVPPRHSVDCFIKNNYLPRLLTAGTKDVAERKNTSTQAKEREVFGCNSHYNI